MPYMDCMGFDKLFVKNMDKHVQTELLNCLNWMEPIRNFTPKPLVLYFGKEKESEASKPDDEKNLGIFLGGTLQNLTV